MTIKKGKRYKMKESFGALGGDDYTFDVQVSGIVERGGKVIIEWFHWNRRMNFLQRWTASRNESESQKFSTMVVEEIVNDEKMLTETEI